MARATKRPESSVFQFRKRIPPDVRALVGGPTHVKESLRTRNPEESKRLFRETEARYEAQWAQIRLGLQDLDDMQVAALAGEVYRDLVGRMGNQRNAWARHAWAGFKWGCELLDKEEFSTPWPEWLDKLDRVHGPNVNHVLNARGMSLSGGAYGRLLVSVHRESKNAGDVMLRQANGDWSADANLSRFPGMEIVEPASPKHQFEAVWQLWLIDAKPADGTVRRWKPVLDRMFGWLGTTDMSKVTEKQLSDWFDGLLLDGAHNNTVAKVHLAAAKRIFGFAKGRKIIAVNPTAELEVSSGTKFERKMRGFEPHEAAIVLKATLRPPSGKSSPALAAARRWVPWICAYTGARVNEVTQARACDFSVVDGMTVLHVTAEAGTTKTGNRKVPLHPDLMEQGFGTFLATKAGEDPLFYVPRPSSAAAIPPYEDMGGRLSKWVRGLGIVDKSLDPNHAWRHRFKTVAGDADIQERVADAIQGHAPTSQGRRYGEVSIKQRIAAIRKMPRIEIDEVG